MQAHEDRMQPPSMCEVERAAIIDMLYYTLGDKERAADLLMIGRSTLYRKIRDYDVGPAEYERTMGAVVRVMVVAA